MTYKKRQKNSMCRVYISGPISGRPFWKVCDDFNKAEELLNAAGFSTVNPLRNGLPFNASHAAHMKKDITMECGCDRIYYVRHWKRWVSVGVWMERLVAWCTGIAEVRKKEMLSRLADNDWED